MAALDRAGARPILRPNRTGAADFRASPVLIFVFTGSGMFAVFKSGGKQHRVAAGDVVVLEKLPGEAGDLIAFEQVLAVGDGKSQTIGAPLVDGATIAGTIVEQDRADKIVVFKKRRRKGYRRTRGHRQQVTVVRIDDILTGGRKPEAKPKSAAKSKAKPEAEGDAAPAADATGKEKEKRAAPKAKASGSPARARATGAGKKPQAKKPAAKKAPAKSSKEKS